MKRVLALILASFMIFTLVGCQNNEEQNTPEDTSTPVVETPENTTPETPDVTDPQEPTDSEETEPVETEGLGEAMLSLYNPDASADTSLVSIVGYLPFRADRGVGTSELIPDAAILVVDFEEPIRDKLYTQQYQLIALEEAAFVYQLGVGNDKYSIANVKTSNYFDEMMAKCYVLEPAPDEIKDICAGFIVDQYNCNGSKFSADYKSDFNFYGDGWFSFSTSGNTDKICINYKQTDTDIYYLSLNLNEVVEISEDAINPKVANKEFRDSIVFLSDINDFNSKTGTYGKDVDLKNTVFYQDALAIRMSNDCGLNLRNKDYFYCIDNTYIIYDMYDADGYRVKVSYFVPEKSYNGYINETENRIERIVGEDAYVYVNPNGGKNIYVYKNDKCMGKLCVEAANPADRSTYENLNMLFGFKPND